MRLGWMTVALAALMTMFAAPAQASSTQARPRRHLRIVAGGYEASGTLNGGNIQVRRR